MSAETQVMALFRHCEAVFRAELESIVAAGEARDLDLDLLATKAMKTMPPETGRPADYDEGVVLVKEMLRGIASGDVYDDTDPS